MRHYPIMNLRNELFINQIVRNNMACVNESIAISLRGITIDNICVAVGYGSVNGDVVNACGTINTNLREDIKEYEY